MGDERDPLITLGGTALKVYMYLLSKRDYVGVRELQRAMGFKSPSTARHHLERLVEVGLAEKSSHGYKALPPQGILREVVVVRGKMIPRSMFITGFLVASTIAYILLPGRDLVASILLVVVSLLQSINTLAFYRSLKKTLSG